MPMRLALLAAAVLALASCSKPPPPPAPYSSAISTDEVMAHVMNPQAYAFWAGSGSRLTAKGWEDLSPKTDEAWKKVEDGAAAVVLATNTLMLPAYEREPRAEWDKDAKLVADIALRGKAAADRHDVEAISNIGEELDVACDACHLRFDPNMKPPPGARR
jgi:hypothetical protein